jgi:hypothetical protein
MQKAAKQIKMNTFGYGISVFELDHVFKIDCYDVWIEVTEPHKLLGRPVTGNVVRK